MVLQGIASRGVVGIVCAVLSAAALAQAENGFTTLDTTSYWNNEFRCCVPGWMIGQGIVATPEYPVLENFSFFVTASFVIAMSEGLRWSLRIREVTATPRRKHPQPEPASATPMRVLADLFVPTSGPKNTFNRGLEAAIQMGTGIAIYRR